MSNRALLTALYVFGLVLWLTFVYERQGTLTIWSLLNYPLGLYVLSKTLLPYFDTPTDKPKRKLKVRHLEIDLTPFWESLNDNLPKFMSMGIWLIGGGIAVAALSAFMIKFAETRPAEEWQGIAYALLCQVVPVIGALIVTLSVMIKRDEWRLTQLRKQQADRDGQR